MRYIVVGQMSGCWRWSVQRELVTISELTPRETMRPANVDSVDGIDKRPNTGTRTVTIEGREQVVVSASDSVPLDSVPLDSVPLESRVCTVECASGERATDEWTGVPVEALAVSAKFPEETTHLRLAARDFKADVPIRAALGGILAFERTTGRDDEQVGLPRFIADDVPGERLVKRVRRVNAVALDPDENPIIG